MCLFFKAKELEVNLEKYDMKQSRCHKMDLMLINHHHRSLNNRHALRPINPAESCLFYLGNRQSDVLSQSIPRGHKVKQLIAQ